MPTPWTSCLAGAALLLALAGAGCGETSRRVILPPDGLDHPSASKRSAAVVAVSAQEDLRHVPELIELLDDEDPAVRVIAGATLRELTGHDTGYQAWAPPDVRRDHVLKWRAWWASRSGDGGPAVLPIRAASSSSSSSPASSRVPFRAPSLGGTGVPAPPPPPPLGTRPMPAAGPSSSPPPPPPPPPWPPERGASR